MLIPFHIIKLLTETSIHCLLSRWFSCTRYFQSINTYTNGYYDTFEPNHHDSYMGGVGFYPFLPSGNILLSDMQTGLYVFEVNYENPLTTEEILVQITIRFS